MLANDSSYAQYEARQWSKFGQGNGTLTKAIVHYDKRNEQDLRSVLQRYSSLVSSPVLCVGARLGGEVKAFQSLPHVSLAIGVDFNPGERNEWVMYGDAHKLHRFKNGTFGTVFSNVLDHILYVPLFVAEARRVLAPRGILLIDNQNQTLRDDKWAVRDMWVSKSLIEEQIQVGFELVRHSSRRNWAGRTHDLYVLRRSDSGAGDRRARR